MGYKSQKAVNSAIKRKIKCRECKTNIKIKLAEEWNRVCPSCDKIIFYSRKSDFEKAERIEQICRRCTDKKRITDNNSGLLRICPECNDKIIYKVIDSCTRANKKSSLCKSCVAKSYYKKPRMLGSKEYINNMVDKGFYFSLHGKSHLEWSKEYNIPATSFNLFAQKNINLSEGELIDFCSGYKKHLTVLENIICDKLNLSFYNKKCHNDLIYRPDFKLSDEIYMNVDGLFWHSEKVISDKLYHFNMRKDFENYGLRIFQFRADDVKNKTNILFSIANNILNKTANKIGARKTEIKIVDAETAIGFLNDNHIKGYINSNHIGLYYNNDLVSIMSYKLGKKNEQKFIKIDRFCSRINYNIVGGFSKLLKNITKDYPNFPVHYWVDLRYGTGSFLLNHGFEFKRETLGWEWTDFENTYNRLQCRANMDERKLSEKEYANEFRWVKIYDAGQRLYIK
jgi:hypothetical protein